MFEDLIWFEDNHLFKLLQDDFHQCRGSIFDFGWYVSHHADRLLSKDSPIVQYTLGSYSPASLKSSHFYNHFPRKASNLDGEHHYISVDHEMVRWLPRKITKQIFPERNGKFTAYPVPTLEELALCNERSGRAYWNRSGIWTCSCDEVDDSCDEHGPKIFEKYEEYVSWRRKMNAEDNTTS